MERRSKKHQDTGIGGEMEKQVKEFKREWRHLRKFGDENHLLFASFIVVLTAIVIVNTTYVINRGNGAQANQSAQSNLPDDDDQVLTSLQTGTLGSVRAKVSNVTENEKKDYAFAVDPTQTMLILDISLTNLGSDTQQLIPVNQFYVRSNEGDYSPLHASMYVTKPLEGGDVAPGQTVTGQLSFAVPKRVAKPLLYVDTGWDGYTPIVFDVLH